MEVPVMVCFLICFLGATTAHPRRLGRSVSNSYTQATDFLRRLEKEHPAFLRKSIDGFIWEHFLELYDTDNDKKVQEKGKLQQSYWCI